MGSIKRVSVTESEMKYLPLLMDNDPHPRDFELFIPWVGRQFNIPNVTTKRLNKGEYQPAAQQHKKPSKHADHIQHLSKKDFGSSTKEFMEEEEKTSIGLNSPIDVADVTISAYYNTNGVLVEIAFIDCPVPVPTKMFMIIQLCLPYHPQLTRITWKGAGLTSILVHEISKIIPGSEITDVILDGCCVPEGNYYLLLDKATNLKYLSLSHCEINDGVCVMIAERIQRNRPAAKNLLVLNLSSNCITDVGAEALGRSLRTNRRLLYLNLCNNDITSVGAAHILWPLTKFKLAVDEYEDAKLQILKNKLVRLGNDEPLKENRKINVNFKQTQELKQKSKLKKKTNVHSHVQDSDNEAQMSDCSDIYLSTAKKGKEGSWYSSGNLTLCALNLAYNRLDSSIVKRIVDVVSYQFRKHKSSKTGLLRLVIEGNPLPETCKQYDLISKYIDLAIAQATPQKQSMHPMSLKKSKSMMSQTEQRSEQKLARVQSSS